MKMFSKLLVHDVFIYNGRAWQVVTEGLAFCPETTANEYFPPRRMVEFVGHGIWPSEERLNGSGA